MGQSMINKIVMIVSLLLVTVSSGWSQGIPDAESLFDRFSDRLYQINLVEKTSGETFSSGSGFQVSQNGHIATNYHVIASLIHKPDNYR